MKSSFIIAVLPLLLTTALAVPTAKPSDTDPVEVCTQATDGQPCIVVEVDGVRGAGRCVFDLASRDWFPLIFQMERRALTGLYSSYLVGPFVSLNRFRMEMLKGVSWRKEEGRKGGGHLVSRELPSNINFAISGAIFGRDGEVFGGQAGRICFSRL